MIEAQDVGGEGAQPGEDARSLADAGCVLGKAAVTDVVGAVLDSPVFADGAGGFRGRWNDVADVVGCLVGFLPQAGGRGPFAGLTLDADDSGEMVVPFAADQGLSRQEDFI